MCKQVAGHFKYGLKIQLCDIVTVSSEEIPLQETVPKQVLLLNMELVSEERREAAV